MSSADVSRFVTLALDDQKIREELEKNPEQAFQGHNLTPQEKEAIKSANEQELRHMGLDPMTARSWSAFHDVENFAPDMPNLPGDLPKES